VTWSISYRDAFPRDLGILRGPSVWRRTALLFGYCLVVVMVCADVDLVRVDHASFEQVLLFDLAILLVANCAGFAARYRWDVRTAAEPAWTDDTTTVEQARRAWRQKFNVSA